MGILSDYRLPDYDGLSALSLAREKQPLVPFIFHSGALSEDRAVESLRQGSAVRALARTPVKAQDIADTAGVELV